MSNVSRTKRHLWLLALAAAALILGEAVMAIEEPAFDRLEKAGNMEIREYRPLIVAETYVDGDMATASNQGFRLIADYIFGNNLSVRGGGKQSEKIAMTAPVQMEPAPRSEKIAMTAPVQMEPQAGTGSATMKARRWRVQFTMPSQYSMANLPKPVNPAVKLRQVPAKRHAVIVFSGLAGEAKVQEQTDQLMAWIKAKNRKPLSTPQLARYNPPWTLPFMRRNEILVEISGP